MNVNVMSLNIWCGKMREPLEPFLKKYSGEADIFFFQEVAEFVGLDRSDKFIGRQELESMFPSFQYFYVMQQNDMAHPLLDSVPFHMLQGIYVHKSFLVERSWSVDVLHDNSHRLQLLSLQKDGEAFCVANYHGVQRIGEPKIDTDERWLQAEIVRREVMSLSCPYIFGGDLNLVPENKSFQAMTEGMRDLVKEYGVESTRNEHFPYLHESTYSDYLLTNPEMRVDDFKVLPDIVSDHQPLMLNVEL